jgi:hypothetical protein
MRLWRGFARVGSQEGTNSIMFIDYICISWNTKEMHHLKKVIMIKRRETLEPWALIVFVWHIHAKSHMLLCKQRKIGIAKGGIGCFNIDSGCFNTFSCLNCIWSYKVAYGGWVGKNICSFGMINNDIQKGVDLVYGEDDVSQIEGLNTRWRKC